MKRDSDKRLPWDPKPLAAMRTLCYPCRMNQRTPDEDKDDPIELWGTRIGRGLGFLMTIGIILAIIVWLGAARP
jgi:hypothetical protein